MGAQITSPNFGNGGWATVLHTPTHSVLLNTAGDLINAHATGDAWTAIMFRADGGVTAPVTRSSRRGACRAAKEEPLI